MSGGSTMTNSPMDINWRSGAAAAVALAGIQKPKKEKKPPKP
jgi:hypothetical protein